MTMLCFPAAALERDAADPPGGIKSNPGISQCRLA